MLDVVDVDETFTMGIILLVCEDGDKQISGVVVEERVGTVETIWFSFVFDKMCGEISGTADVDDCSFGDPATVLTFWIKILGELPLTPIELLPLPFAKLLPANGIDVLKLFILCVNYFFY